MDAHRRCHGGTWEPGRAGGRGGVGQCVGAVSAGSGARTTRSAG
jgi:hypothetical protein